MVIAADDDDNDDDDDDINAIQLLPAAVLCLAAPTAAS